MKMICEKVDICSYKIKGRHCTPHHYQEECNLVCSLNDARIKCKCVPYDLKYKMVRAINERYEK
jgi:hypothetical protein